MFFPQNDEFELLKRKVGKSKINGNVYLDCIKTVLVDWFTGQTSFNNSFRRSRSSLDPPAKCRKTGHFSCLRVDPVIYRFPDGKNSFNISRGSVSDVGDTA